MPINRNMATADVEPISPELVLVCPELREQALAALPDFTWHALVAQVRVRATPPPTEIRLGLLVARQTVVNVISLLPLALAAFLCGTLATLAMTLIADAIR